MDRRKDMQSVENFREQILRILNTGLEETQTQHPLDVSKLFDCERPTLGDTVPIELYRTVRLLALREVLGSKVSSAILRVSGKSVSGKMGITSLPELTSAFGDLAIGKLKVEERADDRVILNLTECATCSGIPNIGEAVCHFEAGLIAGGLEGILGPQVKVLETQCWGLGDRVCRWEARKDPKGKETDQLELMMMLANRTASTVENSIAVRQKNRELREAYQQLRESERLKKDLTAMVVHDMRTPLTAVMGSIETLSDMMGSKLTKQESELLSMALSSGSTLLSMINDLLDVSKLEEHKLSLRRSPISVGDLIEQAVQQVEILARKSRLSLDAYIPSGMPEIHADRERLVRVLVNLLGNAIKHTRAGGTVSVKAEVDDRMLRISVSDTGEGIPKEYHDRIFEKFFQVDPQRSKKRTSTGFGLTFCKLTVEAHGGRIWVESEPGLGSTFTFTLPVKIE